MLRLVLSPEMASPIFWVVDFSCWGWTAEATASALPLTKSPACSRYDFSESGLAAEESWVMLASARWRRMGRVVAAALEAI